MRSRASFLLLLLVALPCLSSAKSTSATLQPATLAANVENSSSTGGESSETSNPPELPAPVTTQSTFDKVINYIENAVKETILPSDQDAYNQLMGGVSPTIGPPGTSIDANGSSATTTGIVTSIEDFFNPLAQSFYLLIDSLLRAYKGKALPCIITSWVPLEGTCTPLTSAPDTNMPVPAPSGPQSRR